MKSQLRAYAWVVWFVAALFYAVEFFQRVAPGVIAKPLIHTFHFDATDLGFVISFYFWAYAISQIPVGVLLDRYGAKICLALAALAVSIGTFLFASAHFLWILGVARVLVGIGSAFAFVGCLKLASRWFPAHWFGFIVGLTNTLGVIGALFGEEPLSYLVSAIGWQSSLILSVCIGIAVAILILLFVKNRPPIKPNPSHPCCETKLSVVHTLKHVIAQPQTWLIAIYAGLMVAPVIAFAELWAIPFLETADKLNSHLASQANTLIFIGIAVGGPVNGMIAGLLKRRKWVMMAGNLLALICLSLVVFGHQGNLFWTEELLFGFGFFTSSMLMCFPLNCEYHAPEMSATVIAFTNMLIMAIGAIFQPTIGKILDWTMHADKLTHYSVHDYRMAAGILPIVLVINLILIQFIREPKAKMA